MERSVCPCNGKLYTQSYYFLHKKGRCHQEWENSISEELRIEREREQEEEELRQEEVEVYINSDGEEETYCKRLFN